MYTYVVPLMNNVLSGYYFASTDFATQEGERGKGSREF